MARDIDAEIAAMMVDIDARHKREYQEIAAARRTPVTPGRCPGAGLRTTSAGGYDFTVCSVCYAVLGPWDWDNSWPLAVEHDRRITD